MSLFIDQQFSPDLEDLIHLYVDASAKLNLALDTHVDNYRRQIEACKEFQNSLKQMMIQAIVRPLARELIIQYATNLPANFAMAGKRLNLQGLPPQARREFRHFQRRGRK